MGTEWAAHEIAYAAASEQNIDLMVVNESNKKILPKPELFEDIQGVYYCTKELLRLHRYSLFKIK